MDLNKKDNIKRMHTNKLIYIISAIIGYYCLNKFSGVASNGPHNGRPALVSALKMYYLLFGPQ